MSLLIQAQTSNDDEEISGCIDFVLKSAKLGLIHESIDVNNLGSYTSESLPVPSHESKKLTRSFQEAGLPGQMGCLPRLY